MPKMICDLCGKKFNRYGKKDPLKKILEHIVQEHIAQPIHCHSTVIHQGEIIAEQKQETAFVIYKCWCGQQNPSEDTMIEHLKRWARYVTKDLKHDLDISGVFSHMHEHMLGVKP